MSARSTTRGSNGGIHRRDSAIVAKAVNGQSNDASLVDHATRMSRDQFHTSSDLLHAAPEKFLRNLDRILSGRDTYVG